MRRVAVIQARMGSTRLPGKVLQDLGGETVLARTLRRVSRSALLDEVVIATTAEPADEQVVEEGNRLGAPVFRGSEHDVLDRYYRAAAARGADVVVRVTSDCPLIEPEVVDKVIAAFSSGDFDYASNSLQRTYPRGLDVEVMTFDALARAWRKAEAAYQRTHVTPYLYQNPDSFRLLSVTAGEGLDFSHYRWTVDTPQDLELVRRLYAGLGNRGDFHWTEVLELLRRSPELSEINREVRQKELWEG